MSNKIKKKQKKIWQSKVVALKKYHCDECNQDFLLQVHELYKEKTLKYLEEHEMVCPLCKNELKRL